MKHFITNYTIISLLLVVIMILTSSCSSISKLVGGRVKYDYAYNFESMKSYNFYTRPDLVNTDSNYLFLQQAGIVLIIENRLSEKKIIKERYLTPDFQLNYYFAGDESISTAELNKLFAYNLGLAWDDKYGSGKGTANSSHMFSRGTLIIDLVDKKHNRLIWRGSTPTRVKLTDLPDGSREAFIKATKVILNPFPPENNFKSLQQSVPD